MSVSISGDADQAKKLKEQSESSKVIRGMVSEKEESDSEQEEIDDQGMIVRFSNGDVDCGNSKFLWKRKHLAEKNLKANSEANECK